MKMKMTTQSPDVAGSASLERALRTTSNTSSPELKAAVRAFVDETKSRGWQIEQIIVRMKSIATEATGAAEIRLTGVSNDRSNATRIADQAISWAIAHYYGEPAR